MIAERFSPDHLRSMHLQAAQHSAADLWQRQEYMDRLLSGPCGTFRDGERIIAWAGI